MTDVIDYDKIVNDALPGTEPAPQPDLPVAAPAAQPAPIDYDRLVGKTIEDNTRQQFLETLKNSKGIVPERQAQAIEVAQLRGVPVGVAYKYLEDLQPKPVAADYESMTHQAPATAKLLADPVKGPVAFPDASPLGDIEKALKDFTSQPSIKAEELQRHATEASVSGFLSYLNSLGKKTPEESVIATEQNIRDRAAAAASAQEAATAALAEKQKMQQGAEAGYKDFEAQRGNLDAQDPMAVPKPQADANMAMDTRAARVSRAALDVALKNPVTEDYWRNLFDTAVSSAFSMLSMAGRDIGAKGDILSAMIPDNLEPFVYSRLPQLSILYTPPGMRNEKGQGAIVQGADAFDKMLSAVFPGDVTRQGDFSTMLASGVGSIGTFATVGSVARSLGLSANVVVSILGALSQGGANAQDAANANASPLVQLMSNLAGNISGATEGWVGWDKMLAGFPEAKTLVQKLVEIGLTGTKEGTQEYTQQLISDSVPVLTYDRARDILGNSFWSGVVGALTGGGLSAVTIGTHAVADWNHQRIIALGEAAKKAKIAEHAPKILDEHLQQMVQNGSAPESVTAPLQAVETLFQELGEEFITQFPKTAKSIEEARAHQGPDQKASTVEVTIPTEELVRLGKLKGYGNFAADVRVGDTLTLNEAIKLRDDVNKYVSEQDLSNGPKRQEETPFFQNLRDQLVAAGQSKEVANTQARLFDAVFNNLAERTGIPVEELARRHGITVSNTAIQGAGQTTLSQDTSSPEFKSWFRNSHAVEKGGVPLVVYHGTGENFTTFDLSQATPNSYLGRAFYFTPSQEEAGTQYASGKEGSDRKARGSANAVMPVYLSIQNPVIFGGKKATSFAGAELDRFSQMFLDVVRERTGGDPHFVSGAEYMRTRFRKEAGGGALKASDIADLVARQIGLNPADFTSDAPVEKMDWLRETFQRMGYDGVIDNLAGQRFKSTGAAKTHYAVFNPEQIKSVNNQGTFDPNNPNILYQDGAPIDQASQDFLNSLNDRERANVNPIYTGQVPAKKLSGNQAAARWLENHFQGNAVTDFTKQIPDEILREIGNTMAAEAIHAMQKSGNAYDWYSEAMKRALDIAAIKWPMLGSDQAAAEAGFGTAENARFVFTYIMAVTSQNLDVAANATATSKAFDQMVERVKAGDYTMSKAWGTGDKQAAMAKNFAKFGPLIDAMPGASFPEKLAALDNLFRQKMTVAEWVREMKADGVPYSKPGQTAMDAMVYGSSLLGPKIGNGFWQNLNGNFSPLTIDLWMRRTWGRLTGKSIGNEAALPAQRRRLKASVERAINSPERDLDPLIEVYLERRSNNARIRALEARTDLTKKVQTAAIKKLKARNVELDDMAADYRGIPAPEAWKPEYDTDSAALADYSKRLLKTWDKEYKRLREKYGKKVPAKMQPTWARAAKRLKADLTTPLDQVANGTQRKQIEKAVGYAQAKLAELGHNVTTADLQAILWYPEKELWNALSSKLEVDEDGDPIIPPSPLNESYDTVFARILNAEGYDTGAQQGAPGNAAGGGNLGAVAGGPDAGSGPGGSADQVVPGPNGQPTQTGQALNGGPQAGPSSSQTTLYQADEIRGPMEQLQAWKDESSLTTTEQLTQAAAAEKPGFDAKLQDIAVQLGIDFKAGPLKTGERISEKIQDKRYPSASYVTDAVRASLYPTTPAEADTAATRIADAFGGEVIDEGWKVNMVGYADRKILVRLPSGVVAEIQLLEPSLADAKDNKGGHDLYDQVRVLKPGDPEIARLNQLQKDLYQPLLDALPADWKAALGIGGVPGNNSASTASDTGRALNPTSPAFTGSQDPSMSAQASPDVQNAGRPSQTQALGVDFSIDPIVSQNGQSVKPGARGSIQFGPLRDRFHITLTEKANLSTFIHEGGHFFLEVLQDLVERGEASPEMTADLKTLRKWMGLKDGQAVTRAGHEKFARTWEQYLMEGKAPSLALHGIFQKFKAWMIFVYKRLANVKGDLNDEIRSVMDRLVASDAAIAEARALVGWRGAPLSQDETGLDDASQKAYEAAWIKANDAQSQDADARIMLEAARELKKTWADEKTKVTQEVEKALAETRGWKAWKLLENGEGLEEFGRTGLKIDPDTVPKEWGQTAKGLTAPADAGGMPLDMVAEILGFDTGEQMLQSIGGARLAQKAIPARVRQVMMERHGEMDSAQLAQEAMRAVHNTPTMDVLLTEFRALAQKANMKVGKDTVRMIVAAAQERVAQIQGRKLEPAKWRRAEVKAAEEAGKYAAQGKTTDAALAKRRQMMAAAMAKASLEAQDRIGAIKDYLSTFTTNRRRAALGKAGEAYLDQVDQILEAIQFKDVSLKAIKARQGLDEFVKEQEAQGEPVFISSETRDLLGRRNYTEMTLQELEGVHDAVKNLWTVAKEINTVRKGAEKIALENALADITRETEEVIPLKKQRDHLNPSKLDRMMTGLSRYHAGNLKIEFVLDWLGKTAHSLIYQPITNASYDAWKLHKDLTAPFMEKLRSMPAAQKKRWNTKRQFLNYPIPLKGSNIWTIALNMGNASNKEKLLAGYGWTESQVMAELNTFMTKEDWDLVQETLDTIESMWPKMEAVVKKATGLAPPKIQATPIETPYGTYRGGYFPVVYDTQIDARMDDKLDSSISTEEMFSKRFTAFVINNGFTKGRTKNVGKLLFSPDIIADHLGEVIHYVTHYEAVKQADKIIRSPVFKQLVKSRLGDAVYAEMKQWLKDVATNTTRSDRQAKAGDWALRWARNSAQLTSLGLNIKSALKQPLGLVATLDALKPKHLAVGIQKAWLSPYVVTNWKFAFSHSKELGPLVRNYDRDLAAISKAYADSLGNRAYQGIYQTAFLPISVMQSVANVAAWHGAYSQATEQGMSEQDAFDYADKIVRTTQGSGALKDLSGMQRGGEANKFFTMYYTFFGILYNRVADIQMRERGIKKLHRKVGRYAVLLLMGELFNSLFDDAWDEMFPPDRKREDDDQSFFTRLALNTVDSAVNTLPVARDAYAAVSAIVSGTQARTPPALAGVAKAIAGGKAIMDLVEGNDMTRAKARNIAALAGFISNQPIYGVYRAIDDVFGSTMFPE